MKTHRIVADPYWFNYLENNEISLSIDRNENYKKGDKLIIMRYKKSDLFMMTAVQELDDKYISCHIDEIIEMQTDNSILLKVKNKEVKLWNR